MAHDTTEKHYTSAPKKGPLKHDAEGGEILDPTPMQPPLGYKKTLSLSEQIIQQVRLAKLQQLEDDAIAETDEEADDFEVGEDYEPLSKYENEHIPPIKVLKEKAAKIKAAIKKKEAEAAIEAYKAREASLKPPPKAAEPSLPTPTEKTE